MRKENFSVHVLSDCIVSYDWQKIDNMLVYYASKGCTVERLSEVIEFEHACKLATERGYSAVFLCGSYAYYSRFEFVPTYKYGIFHCNDKTKDADWCMVKELKKGYLSTVKGTVCIE